MPWIKSCLCHQEKKKPPVISPPIHLLLKPEGSNSPGAGHAFRCKVFKRPRPCHLCHQPIYNQGSCCRVCKYVCHKVCESKEAADRFSDTSWQIHRQWHTQKPQQTGNQGRKNGNSTQKNEKQTKTNDADISNGIYASLKNERVANGSANKTTRKVIEIQTIQTTLERNNDNDGEKSERISNNGDIILHTHDEPDRNNGGDRMNKMITSSSYNGVYGEALTTQPRSTKNSGGGSTGGMDLSYVTERIIALWFPASCSQQAFRQGQKQASHMLINKHGDNYMVFNLSEQKRALRNEHKHVEEVGWSQSLAPPLERICSVCKQIDSWLSSDQHRIAVIHTRGSKDKLGVVVAAYMHYSNICGSAEQALDRFSMRKFLEDNIGPLYLPSNRRYVEYFAGLLSHNIKINSAPLYLTHVTVLGAPSFQNGGCRAFLKLYEGHTPIYTSGVYTVSSGVGQFTVNVAGERRRGLQLRGDILIKCYHRSESSRETVFACQFHTCAVADYTLSFTRQELDNACNDPRFPVDGAVELHFSPGPDSRHSGPAPAPTPAVPVNMTDDSITRANSPFEYEDSDDDDDDTDSDDVNHTFGPLDGSIYATISKKTELSPGAVSSPLTVSMDSGISSAGHQQNVNTNTSASPPLTGHPSPLSPEEQHRELDELLSDMMLTVQSIPDLKPRSELDNVRFIDDDEEDKNIPYHARQDSRPFSYGVNMIGDTKKLSSPGLVRKASFNNTNNGTVNKVQAQVYPDFSSKYNNNNTKFDFNYKTRDPIDDIFTPKALAANQSSPIKREIREEFYKETTRKVDPMKRSFTDSTLRNSNDRNYHKTNAFSDSESLSPPSGFKSTKTENYHDTYSNNNLTWLQRQQLKLKERKEMQLREERQPYESSLISELRLVQNRHMRPTASHRLDGYTSDTTAFADDDDDFAIPLHINTKNATSPISSSYNNTISYTNGRKERPFVAVKRAHEQYSKNSSSPEHALTSHPMGHVVRSPSRSADITDGGLLSLAGQDGKRLTSNSSVGIDSTLERHALITKADSNSRIDALNDLMANLSHGSDKSLTSSNSSTATNPWQYRDETYSSWRSNEADSSSPHSVSSRPQTPAFPVSRTPYANATTPTVQFDLPNERLPPKSPTTSRKDRPLSPDFTNGSSNEFFHSTARNFSENNQYSPRSLNGSSSPTVYQGTSRRSSFNSSSNENTQEVSPAHVKFVSDTSRFWYKPTISREDAINMLRNQNPGTFVVRNSNTFAGGFGLALKVAQVPMNVQNKDELVRHFLIEPTSRGVRLKGCSNEPVFSSLSALIYQHSITHLALPCRLILPERDIGPYEHSTNQTQQLLLQGAACNVLYLFTMDMESLTGPQAVKKATTELFNLKVPPTAYIVHFKINRQGVTLTDNKRKLFFRKHYPINAISHCGVDPDERFWNVPAAEDIPKPSKIFGFVARKPASNTDNQCHVFAELEPEQPATAIVNFVTKVLTATGIKPNLV